MNSITPFSFESHTVRTLTIDGEPWFVAKDVAEALGYTDTDQAIRKHVDAQDRLTRRIDGVGQRRSVIVINESGTYDLTFGSELESAKRFKRWVTSVVLPSIRKTGAYALPGLNSITKDFRALYSVAKLIFNDRNQALLSTAKAIQRNTGVDLLDQLGAVHLVAETQEQLLTPTEIGLRLGGKSARVVNQLLLALDMQIDYRDHRGELKWELTESGQPYGVYLDTGKQYSDGTPVKQIKWYARVVDLLRSELEPVAE